MPFHGLLDPGDWSLGTLIGVLAAAGLAIVVVGTLLTREADRLADRTRLGEAIFGGVFLGASTSLSGSITSISVAYQGFPELAASNAIGGIAVQTAWLSVADMTYRRANLEHAAASVENLMQGTLLCALLAIPLLAIFSPAYAILSIHPVTVLLFVAYLFGLRLTQAARKGQLWRPRLTSETREDEPAETPPVSTALLWLRFGVLVLAAGIAGLVVAQAGIGLVERVGLDATVVGAFVTAVITSSPELVVAVAAVRRGALTLAVGGIIGGNVFDVLFFGFSDIAYREGSLYHAISGGMVFLIALSILMTATLLLGLLRRQRHGIGGIGFESVLVLVFYVVGTLVLVWP